MLCRRIGIARPQVPDLVQAMREVARQFGRDWRTLGSYLPVRADERLKLAAWGFSGGRGVGVVQSYWQRAEALLLVTAFRARNAKELRCSAMRHVPRSLTYVLSCAVESQVAILG